MMYKKNSPRFYRKKLTYYATHNCIYRDVYRIMYDIEAKCGNECEIEFKGNNDVYTMYIKIPNTNKHITFFISKDIDYIYHLYDGKQRGFKIHKNQCFSVLLGKAILFEGIKRTTRFDKIRKIITLAKSKNIGLALTLLNSLK